jgi:simple sugar transport system permease protein
VLGWSLGAGIFEPWVIDLFGVLNGRIDIGAAAGNFRMSIIWWLVLAALFHLLLTRTRFGNAVFATGGHGEAARAQGVDVDRTRVISFVICGGLAALAGVLQVCRLKSVDPLRGEGLELEVIAAVVIGGTLLKGGYGSIIGAVVGTALTGMLRTGLVLSGVPSNAFRGAIGALVIIAVIINTLVRRQR